MKNEESNCLRILAVDDDRTALDLYQEVLRPTRRLRRSESTRGDPKTNLFGNGSPRTLAPSFNVILCRQGDEAVETVRVAIEGNRPFAVVFLDVRMPPGPDGVWTAEHIRALDPYIQIVMVTGYSDLDPVDIACRVLPMEKLFYVHKPFDPQEVRQFALALGAKWHAERQVRKAHAELEARVEERTAELAKANEELRIEMTERKQVEEALQKAHAELEARVEERTAELAKANEELRIEITKRKRMEEALKESEEKYRRIFETSKDVLYLTSREGKFVDINQAGMDLFGYSKEELLKIDLAKHLYASPEDRKRFQEMIEKHGFVKDYEVCFKKKDKTKIYVSITANVRRDRNGDISGYEGIIRDVTDKKKAEEEIKRLYEETRKLADKDPLTGLYNHRRVNELLESEIERAKRGTDTFSIMMLDVDDLKLINDAHGHIVGDKLLKDVAAILKKSSRSVDAIGRYGGDEFLMILPYTDGEKAKTIAKRISRKMQKEGLKINEEITIPIRLSIGVATYPFDSSLSQDLISLADKSMYDSKRFGRSVVSASVVEVSEFLTKESPSLDVLQGLVTAVNSKDHYTKSHSDLVTNYAISLAKKLNLPSEEMEALRIAGFLHDIGKIGIPDTILRKPGPLEKKEFEIVKQHPRLGATMLDGSLPPHREHVLGAIMHHHERYDGKGYPGKLKGKDIPFLARIIGIADAYCAMITDRPYRKALTKDEAIAELREKAGTQFDPDLVSEFIECLKESKS